MKIEGLLLVSGGKTAVILELEEQILHKMALLVCMPVCRSELPCVDAAGNDHDPASFFHPADKLVAVITFTAYLSGQTVPAASVPCRYHCDSRWRAKNSQAHPLPHGLSLSNHPCSVRFLRAIPLFSPAGMLVNFDDRAVQHQRRFIHQVLLD